MEGGWNGPSLGRIGKFKMYKEQRECVCLRVPRLIEQDDVISYEGALEWFAPALTKRTALVEYQASNLASLRKTSLHRLRNG